MSDSITNKIVSLQRCVQRAREEFNDDPEGFRQSYSRQDAAILNILRACENCIDLANLAVRHSKLGVPVSSADAFRLLTTSGVIPVSLSDNLMKMVGFRNLAAHQYSEINLSIVEAVIKNELDALVEFAESIRANFRA